MEARGRSKSALTDTLETELKEDSPKLDAPIYSGHVPSSDL